MTGEERDVTGVKDAKQLRTMRDSVNDLVDDFHELVGSFKQHVKSEETWQQRIEERLLDEHDKMYRVARQCAAEAVEAHEDRVSPKLEKLLLHVDTKNKEDYDRAAVRVFLTDSTRVGLIIVFLVVFSAAAYFSFTNNNNSAGTIFALMGAGSPFALWFLNRKQGGS